jgi:cell division protein FtsZ
MDNNEIQLDRIGPRIAVVGVGGAGGNAVDNMIRSGLSGVTFLICNTDAQALNQSLCPEPQRVRLGFGVTQGLGAGASPEVGRLAAEESIDDVMRHLKGIHMVFVTAGMGGGTGTGAGHVIARAAREQGILTVGVVTKPFHFEGTQRMRAAEKGIEVIRECVDTLLVIPNQNLFRLATQNTTFIQAFAMADDVLYSGVRTFTDLMIKPGLVNSDFADICTVMRNMTGKAMMGTGEAMGESRATEAAEKAIACLLLDDVSIHGAQAVLINITGGPDLTLYDVDEAIGRIKQEVDHELSGREPAQIIFGATFDKDLESVVRVSVVATGIQDPGAVKAKAPEVEPTQVPELPDYDTLGSRHGMFEDQPIVSFSLQEDAEEFGYSGSAKEEVRKPSFFERLTGFGRKKSVAPQPMYRSMEKPLDPQLMGRFPGAPTETGEDMDIPSFLRQKQKKK